MYVEHYKKEMEKLRESTVIELKKQINDYFPLRVKMEKIKKPAWINVTKYLFLKPLEI